MPLIDQMAAAAPAAEDLDRHLLAAKGISAAEMHRMLGTPCLAGMVALAIAPMLAEAPPRGELAGVIMTEGLAELRSRARELYAAALAAEPIDPPPSLTVEGFVDAYLGGTPDDDGAMLEFAAANHEAIAAEFERREAQMPPALKRTIAKAVKAKGRD